MKINLNILALSLLLISNVSIADSATYSGRHEIAIDAANGSFRHVHNWSGKKNKEMFFDFANHEKFFTSENDFSYVEFIDRRGNIVAHWPSPAFKKLWSFRDSIFVGLSSIKVYNPFQIVVWGGDGKIIYKAHFLRKVAKLSDKELENFKEKFPDVDKRLQPFYFYHKETLYCDFSHLRNYIDSDAMEFLESHVVNHPFVKGETATNNVFWYDESAEPRVESNTLIIPTYGEPLVIPLGKPVQLMPKH